MEGAVVVGHWVADEAASRCAACMDKFGALNRKHHCRLCGNVFCGPCVEWSLTHQELGLKEQKGCKVCHRFLTVLLPFLTRGRTFVHYAEDGKRMAMVSLDEAWSGLRIRPLAPRGVGAPSASTPLLTSRSTSMMGGAFAESHGEDDAVDLSRFNCILDGQQTPVFQSYQSHPVFFLSSFLCGAACRPSSGDDMAVLSPFCFSILFGGKRSASGSDHVMLYSSDVRTIDLQAETIEDKQTFIEAVVTFVHWRSTKGGSMFLTFRDQARKIAQIDAHADRAEAERKHLKEIVQDSQRTRERWHASRDAMRDKYGLGRSSNTSDQTT